MGIDTFLKTIKRKLKEKNNSHLYSFIALVALIGIAFFPALNNNFVNWDDQFYITNNPLIVNPTWTTLPRLMDTIVSLNYHPLTMLSLWINAYISGTQSATPFIATNIIIHLANTLLSYIFSYKLSRSWIVAITTSIIFGLHPMHVESIVWVSERKDVLYTLFLLIGLLSYLKYTNTSSKKYYSFSIGLFIMACLSKAMAVVMVPILFLVDIVTEKDLTASQTYTEKIPFIPIALLFGIVAINVQAGGDFHGLLEQLEVKKAVNINIDLLDRISNASFANSYYLVRFFLPFDHSTFHPYSIVNEYNAFLSNAITLGSLCALLWALINRKFNVLFGLGLYFFSILLVLQFLPVGSALVAERYTYIPYIGLAYLAGHSLLNLSQLSGKLLPLMAIVSIATTFTFLTRIQSDSWQDHTTLFTQALKQYPENTFIRKTLASGYWAKGETDSAMHHVEYAINKLGLATSQAIELLGNCHADKGNTKEAIKHFNKAIEIDSTNLTARYHRGLQLLEHDPKKAIIDFNLCEQSDNKYVQHFMYAPRGRAYGLIGNYSMALKDLNKAISIFPNDTNSYMDRAVTYELLGDKTKALEDYTYITKLNPHNQIAITKIELLKSKL